MTMSLRTFMTMSLRTFMTMSVRTFMVMLSIIILGITITTIIMGLQMVVWGHGSFGPR